MNLILPILSLLLLQPAPAAQQQPDNAPAEVQAERVGVPMDAVMLALGDASKHEHFAHEYRYVWIPENDPERAAVADLCVNFSMSRASLPLRSVRVGGNRLLRLDFSQIAPDEKDRKRMLELWEQFAQDEPYFLVDSNVEVGKGDAEKFLVVIADSAQIVDNRNATLKTLEKGDRIKLVDPTVAHGGENSYYKCEGGYILCSSVEVKEEQDKELVEVRAFGPHCGKDAGALTLLCKSQVPIVRYDWFILRTMSTLDSGLYYEFRGIQESPEPKITDTDFFLKEFTGVTEAEVRKLSVDPRNKTVQFRSRVTGKPRAVVFFSGAQSKPTVNQGLVSISQDGFDESIDAAQDPIRNLLDFQHDGTEIFVELPNGMIAYGLFTGDLDGDGRLEVDGDKGEEGALVREAPPNLVTDHTIPEPHTARLQPAISCIRCHLRSFAGVESEGWIKVENDVQTLLSGGLDIFGEGKQFPDREAVDQYAGLYNGRIQKILSRARDDLAEATLRVVGKQPADAESIVVKYHTLLSSHYNAYRFDIVTPQDACRELGFEVAENEAHLMLRRLLPPLPADEAGIAPEDPILGALKNGLSVNRFQWEAVYADAAARTIAALVGEKQ